MSSVQRGQGGQGGAGAEAGNSADRKSVSDDLGIPGCPGCERLSRRVAQLERQVQVLQAQVDKLAAALEESLRAGKRQAAPFSKGKPKAAPKKPGRKKGKDHGKASYRAVPEQVDEILDAALPRKSPCCQSPVIEEGVRPQYQTEIPAVKPLVRRFDVHVGHCERCGKRIQGRHAEQTSDALGAARSQLGPKAIAFSAYLHQDLGVPYQKSCDVLQEAFGIQWTVGGMSLALSRLARHAGASSNALLEEVRESEAVYPDETSARMSGQRWWLWVFATPTTTVYAQRPSRGSDVIDEILGRDFAGLLGHDGWAPYDQLTEAAHQQCLAHLIRRATELEETATRGAVRFPREVKGLLQDALQLRDRRETKELSPDDFSVKRDEMEERLDRILQVRPTHPGNRRFKDHLARHGDELLTFLYLDVEATNWRAEQAIRPAVRFRKTSGGHRSPQGARTRDVLLSILRTARQRALDPLLLFARMLCSTETVLLPAVEDT